MVCSGLGGGWRLPSLTELQTIVDDTKASPSIDSNAFPGTSDTDYYWTSTPVAGDPSSAFTVSFHDGEVGHNPGNVTDGTKNRARCVH